MKERPYQICTYCIMDTSDLEIRFDAEGVCNHCTSYREKLRGQVLSQTDKQNRLDETIAEIKKAGKGKEYDCISGVENPIFFRLMMADGRKPLIESLKIFFEFSFSSL